MRSKLTFSSPVLTPCVTILWRSETNRVNMTPLFVRLVLHDLHWVNVSFAVVAVVLICMKIWFDTSYKRQVLVSDFNPPFQFILFCMAGINHACILGVKVVKWAIKVITKYSGIQKESKWRKESAKVQSHLGHPFWSKASSARGQDFAFQKCEEVMSL